MLTRCPECHTTFRVTPEQLKARQGKVRCGHCQGIFNALETLVEEAPPIPRPPWPTPREELVDLTPTSLEDIPLPSPAPELAPLPAQAPEALAEPAPEPAPEPALEATSAPTPLPTPATTAEPVLALDPIEFAVEAEAAPTTTAATPPLELLPDVEGLPELAEATPEPVLDNPPKAEETVEAWLAEPLADAGAPPRRRWPWVLASLIALLVLSAQVALHFRVELSILLPEFRPGLLAACELAGCELPYPSRIEQIGIETSDLHPDPAAKERLLLTATLKNRAPFVQTWPALELTLTDTGDRALIRRVLTAADYLPADSKAAKGFAAGSEQAISLVLEAKDTPAVGYRLYVFYP